MKRVLSRGVHVNPSRRTREPFSGFHTGSVWPAFTAITGLSLYGREIVVVGFGPVGQGVALRARDLGANVTVVDLDPVRLIQPQHHGCRVADFDDAVRRASVIVTATGSMA
jgi:adenosylhomocysteinase